MGRRDGGQTGAPQRRERGVATEGIETAKNGNDEKETSCQAHAAGDELQRLRPAVRAGSGTAPLHDEPMRGMR